MSLILGIHGFSDGSPRLLHDTGVALVQDGRVVFAVHEERLTRNKNEGAFPHRALALALERAPIPTIDAIAVADERPGWQLREISRTAWRTWRSTGVAMPRYMADTLHRSLDWQRRMPRELAHLPTTFVRHHRCHAASAASTSPWPRCTVVTLDGMGDYCEGGTVGLAEHGRLDLRATTNGFCSPGIFYMIVTDYLGFKPGRHEGKVTGLAAHGDPSRAYASMAEALSYRSDRMDFHSRVIPEAIDECSIVKGAKGRLLWFERAWQGVSREDIAAAAQQRLEDVVVPYVRDAVRLTGEPRVALAGGVFANVSLNRRIRELPEVAGVWVQPAMTDGGLAVGAALALSFDDPRHRPSGGHHPLEHVYLGPSWDDTRIVRALDTAGIAHEHRPHIADDIAAALEQGLVVGHFDGALEYGPRALGHRSVLVAPTDPGINDRLNQRLHRTEFMPFAPAIQEEHAADLLQGWQPDHAAARFMTITYEVTDRFRELAPAAVHVDGTARPQVVRRQQSPRLWEIIERYRQRTGIPAVINTSFNMHEEPIVGSPEDAIRSWKEGAVDVLVMGERWVEGDRCSEPAKPPTMRPGVVTPAGPPSRSSSRLASRRPPPP